MSASLRRPRAGWLPWSLARSLERSRNCSVCPEKLDCIDGSRADDSLVALGQNFWCFRVLLQLFCNHSSGFFHARDASAGIGVFLIGMHCAERLWILFLKPGSYSSRRIRKRSFCQQSPVKFAVRENETEDALSADWSDSTKNQNRTTCSVLKLHGVQLKRRELWTFSTAALQCGLGTFGEVVLVDQIVYILSASNRTPASTRLVKTKQLRWEWLGEKRSESRQRGKRRTRQLQLQLRLAPFPISSISILLVIIGYNCW